jgi:galactokinase
LDEFMSSTQMATDSQQSNRLESVRKVYHESYGTEPQYWGEAPGRIEFIGNHTDYNGGLVMGMAVNLGVAVAVGAGEGQLRFRTAGKEGIITVPATQSQPLQGEASWINYPLGVWRILVQQLELPERGWDLAVYSDLPTGSGLSSSAALELATVEALLQLTGQSMSTIEKARLCRRAENEFVGVPCGLLDQGVSAFGKENALVNIDCATEAFSHAPLPQGSRFWIFQSGVHHSLTASLYSTRFAECKEAAQRLQKQRSERSQLSQWGSGEWESHASDWPENLVRRARHVITENERVRAVSAALKRGDLVEAGRSLFASHSSSQNDFENSIPELDFLVDTLRKTRGVVGARLTGGGFGGAVMAWVSEEAGDAEVKQVQNAFHGRYGKVPAWQEVRSANGSHAGKY